MNNKGLRSEFINAINKLLEDDNFANNVIQLNKENLNSKGLITSALKQMNINDLNDNEIMFLDALPQNKLQ